MKIKRTKNLLYIVSAVMVLGLALLSFDLPVPDKQTVNLPTTAPTKSANTPTPTPTPSLTEILASVSIRPATSSDTGVALTTVITDYLTSRYANEPSVKGLENITCYYKSGFVTNQYFIYVTYDIIYEGSNVPIPALMEEYVVTVNGETIQVDAEPQDAMLKEVLFLSRKSESVLNLYIQELIYRFMNAKLAVDEALLSSMVTDSSYLNLDKIGKETEFIEEYKNLKLLVKPCPETVTEFDYVIYVAHDVKIVNINTLAPGLDEYLITMDENNYPHIFLGVTSEETDLFRASLREQNDYLTFREVNVIQPLADAMLLDADLMEYIGRLLGGN